jgi:hypothetical protein
LLDDVRVAEDEVTAGAGVSHTKARAALLARLRG